MIGGQKILTKTLHNSKSIKKDRSIDDLEMVTGAGDNNKSKATRKLRTDKKDLKSQYNRQKSKSDLKLFRARKNGVFEKKLYDKYNTHNKKKSDIERNPNNQMGRQVVEGHGPIFRINDASDLNLADTKSNRAVSPSSYPIKHQESNRNRRSSDLKSDAFSNEQRNTAYNEKDLKVERLNNNSLNVIEKRNVVSINHKVKKQQDSYKEIESHEKIEERRHNSESCSLRNSHRTYDKTSNHEQSIIENIPKATALDRKEEKTKVLNNSYFKVPQCNRHLYMLRLDKEQERANKHHSLLGPKTFAKRRPFYGPYKSIVRPCQLNKVKMDQVESQFQNLVRYVPQSTRYHRVRNTNERLSPLTLIQSLFHGLKRLTEDDIFKIEQKLIDSMQFLVLEDLLNKARKKVQRILCHLKDCKAPDEISPEFLDYLRNEFSILGILLRHTITFHDYDVKSPNETKYTAPGEGKTKENNEKENYQFNRNLNLSCWNMHDTMLRSLGKGHLNQDFRGTKAGGGSTIDLTYKDPFSLDCNEDIEEEEQIINEDGRENNSYTGLSCSNSDGEPRSNSIQQKDKNYIQNPNVKQEKLFQVNEAKVVQDITICCVLVAPMDPNALKQGVVSLIQRLSLKETLIDTATSNGAWQIVIIGLNIWLHVPDLSTNLFQLTSILSRSRVFLPPISHLYYCTDVVCSALERYAVNHEYFAAGFLALAGLVIAIDNNREYDMSVKHYFDSSSLYTDSFHFSIVSNEEREEDAFDQVGTNENANEENEVHQSVLDRILTVLMNIYEEENSIFTFRQKKKRSRRPINEKGCESKSKVEKNFLSSISISNTKERGCKYINQISNNDQYDAYLVSSVMLLTSSLVYAIPDIKEHLYRHVPIHSLIQDALNFSVKKSTAETERCILRGTAFIGIGAMSEGEDELDQKWNIYSIVDKSFNEKSIITHIAKVVRLFGKGNQKLAASSLLASNYMCRYASTRSTLIDLKVTRAIVRNLEIYPEYIPIIHWGSIALSSLCFHESSAPELIKLLLTSQVKNIEKATLEYCNKYTNLISNNNETHTQNQIYDIRDEQNKEEDTKYDELEGKEKDESMVNRIDEKEFLHLGGACLNLYRFSSRNLLLAVENAEMGYDYQHQRGVSDEAQVKITKEALKLLYFD